ncbi:hypothetical protein [Rubrivirga sp.]|uniref:hypothetical protein n=1 Tax=Rubrivirga sp. TaxID=1885344 RepID=UPI003C7866F6
MLRHLSLALLVAFGIAGCDHVTDVEGPLLTDRFGDFSILDPLVASQSAVDFAAGESIVFTARFNKQTDWVLEIAGEQSGAVRRIEGFSAELTEANARWNGRTTDLPLFKDEPVSARLFFPDEINSDTSFVDVAVLSPRSYPGSVVADFEGGDDVTLGNFEFELQGSGISAEIPPAQGNGFYLFRGTDSVVSNFFVGLIDIRPPSGSFFDVPTTVPEDLYINFFVYGFDTPNTIAVIQLIADNNGSGDFEDGQDTVFPFGDIPVDFQGWQAFSKPLSELGLTQAQAAEIVAVRALLISDNNNQPSPPLEVEYGIDYITFTSGGPLEL